MCLIELLFFGFAFFNRLSICWFSYQIDDICQFLQLLLSSISQPKYATYYIYLRCGYVCSFICSQKLFTSQVHTVIKRILHIKPNLTLLAILKTLIGFKIATRIWTLISAAILIEHTKNKSTHSNNYKKQDFLLNKHDLSLDILQIKNPHQTDWD